METILFFFSENFWATSSTIVAMVLLITSAINKKFEIKQPWKQIVSWVVSLILTVATYFMGLITVSNPVWLSLIGIGIVVGLSSNGVYDIPTIKTFINKLFENFNNKKIESK